MDLRHYLRIFGRQKWLILVCAVVVAVAAGLFAASQTKMYTAGTSVLLRPDDPTEQLGSSASAQSSSDLSRYVAAQATIVKSIPVAQAVAQKLETKETVYQLLGHVSVASNADSNVLGIFARDANPERSRDIANAFAQAYIANRKSFEVGRLQIAVSAIQNRLEGVQSRIDRLTDAGAGSPDGTTAQKAALDAATSQYSSLLSEQENLQVEIDLKHGQAEVISRAETPTGPSSPRPKKDVLIGLFLGLFLGIGLALLREQMDTRIHSVEDAEATTGLALLGQVPYNAPSRSSESHLIMRDQPSSAAAEAIRALRTAVQLRHDHADGDRPRVPRIVITSPGPGDGKSLVAANLAASFAEAGQRTLLVSADLRNPRVESMFRLSKRSPGLGDYVRGNGIAVASVVVSTDVRGLFLLKAGAAVSNPAGVFTSERFDTLLAHATQHVDVIVFDTPPVLAVTDATVIAARADEVILVVADDETSREAANRARSILESGGSAVVLGLVVNKVPHASSSFDSYYRPVVG